MNIQLLGTGASEGIPAVFCRCAVCENARKIGQQEVRLRMGVLIDGELLIDFSPDAIVQALRFGVDYSGLKGLFITHTHGDHLAAEELVARGASNMFEASIPVLPIYGNGEALKKINQVIFDDTSIKTMKFSQMFSGKTIKTENYSVTAFRTEHMTTEDSLIYLFAGEKGNYLHAVDSAMLPDDVYSFLAEKHITLDGVSMDCTFGLLQEEYFGHMNMNQNRKVKERLEQIGAADGHTRFFLTHISHYAGNTHSQLVAAAKQYGFEVAYDGLQVSI